MRASRRWSAAGIRLTKEHQKHQALYKAMVYIDQHYREGIDQKDLAQRCGMTPFRVSRLFKEVHGLGFMEYVLRKRMELAQELLSNRSPASATRPASRILPTSPGPSSSAWAAPPASTETPAARPCRSWLTPRGIAAERVCSPIPET